MEPRIGTNVLYSLQYILYSYVMMEHGMWEQLQCTGLQGAVFALDDRCFRSILLKFARNGQIVKRELHFRVKNNKLAVFVFEFYEFFNSACFLNY
jgi:hypothetical protein